MLVRWWDSTGVVSVLLWDFPILFPAQHLLLFQEPYPPANDQHNQSSPVSTSLQLFTWWKSKAFWQRDRQHAPVAVCMPDKKKKNSPESKKKTIARKEIQSGHPEIITHYSFSWVYLCFWKENSAVACKQTAPGEHAGCLILHFPSFCPCFGCIMLDPNLWALKVDWKWRLDKDPDLVYFWRYCT